MSRSRKIRLNPLGDRGDAQDEYTTDSAEVGEVGSDATSQKEPRRWRRRRPSSLKMLVVLLIVVGVSFGIKAMTMSWLSQTPFPSEAQASLACSRRASFSLQSDHRPHSYGGELYLQAARTSFQFPVGSNEFSIDALSARGSIRFTIDNHTETQAEDLLLGRHIKVDVTAFSDDWLGFERAAKICETTPHFTETGYTSEGLLISADSSRLSEDRTAFDILVRLPTPTWTSRPLLLPNISASMYGFNILVEDMDEYVYFDSLFLRSMGRPIRIGPLRANNARLQNWNGEITGTLTSTNRIDLYAHNGAVSVNASLLASGNHGNTDAETPTLVVTTINGAINADVNLLSQSSTTATGTTVPAYKTIFHTNGAPLTVAYPVAPENHNLTLFASNSHAPTTLRLPDSFVGGLALRSPSPDRRPIVHFDENTDRQGRTLQMTSMSDNVMTARVASRGVIREVHGGLVDAQAIDGDLDLFL